MEETANQPAATGVGARLAAARQAAGLSVDDLCQRIKLSPRQIEALENDQLDQLGPAFVRGFVRSYARAVGLDGDELVSELSGQANLAKKAINIHDEQIPLKRTLPPYWTVFAVVAALLFLLPWLAYRWMSDVPEPAQAPAPVTHRTAPVPARQAAATQPATPSAALAPQPAASGSPVTTAGSAVQAALLPAAPAQQAPTQAAATPAVTAAAPTGAIHHLRLQFAADAWLDIHDASGQRIVSRLYHAGEQARFDVPAPASLVIGNAASVRLEDNDQPVNLVPYTPGKVARLTLH